MPELIYLERIKHHFPIWIAIWTAIFIVENDSSRLIPFSVSSPVYILYLNKNGRYFAYIIYDNLARISEMTDVSLHKIFQWIYSSIFPFIFILTLFYVGSTATAIHITPPPPSTPNEILPTLIFFFPFFFFCSDCLISVIYLICYTI